MFFKMMCSLLSPVQVSCLVNSFFLCFSIFICFLDIVLHLLQLRGIFRHIRVFNYENVLDIARLLKEDRILDTILTKKIKMKVYFFL